MIALRSFAALAAAFLLAACGGGDTDGDPSQMSRGQIADAYLAELDKMSDAIATVTDEESADAAKAKIAESRTRIDALSDAFGEDITGPQAMMLFLSRRKEFMETQARLSASMQSLAAQDPALLNEVNAAMAGATLAEE